MAKQWTTSLLHSSLFSAGQFWVSGKFIHVRSDHRCHHSTPSLCTNSGEFCISAVPPFLMQRTTWANIPDLKGTHLKCNVTDKKNAGPVPSPEMKWRGCQWERMEGRREVPRAAAETHAASNGSWVSLGKSCTRPQQAHSPRSTGLRAGL